MLYSYAESNKTSYKLPWRQWISEITSCLGMTFPKRVSYVREILDTCHCIL